jgi:cell fate regulator YaaT (PSP1 superfamily)
LASKYDSKPLVKLKKNTACLDFSEQNGIGKREMCSVSFEKLPFFPKKDKKIK